MTVTVVLTDELAERVEQVVAERGVAPDELAREVLAANVPAPAAGRHRFGFVGLGASGDGRLSENYKILLNGSVRPRLGDQPRCGFSAVLRVGNVHWISPDRPRSPRATLTKSLAERGRGAV